MKQKGAMTVFFILMIGFFSAAALFVFAGEYRSAWNDQTMLRMEVAYEKDHPTGKTAAYFAGLVSEASGGQMEIAITYNTKPGSENDILAQLKFGGIALAAVNIFDLCEEIPEMNELITPFQSPEEAQDGYHQQMDVLQDYLAKERMESLSCYRPDYRCIAGNRQQGVAGDFTGMKIHAAQVAVLSEYLVKSGAELESFARTDLVRAVDSGYIDGGEMPLLLYNRAGYDKVMPYVWVYDDFLVPDLLVASTVSLGNLTAGQRRILLECAAKTEQYQIEALKEAQQRQWELLQDQKECRWPDERIN